MLLFWTLILFDSYAYSYKSRGCRMCNSPLHFHGMGSWQKIGCKEQPTARPGPSREKVLRKRPQSFPEHKLKIIFPLNMPRAKRRAFQTISPYTARRASAVSARKSAPRGRLPALPPGPGPRWPPSAGRTARRKHRCSRQR